MGTRSSAILNRAKTSPDTVVRATMAVAGGAPEVAYNSRQSGDAMVPSVITETVPRSIFIEDSPPVVLTITVSVGSCGASERTEGSFPQAVSRATIVVAAAIREVLISPFRLGVGLLVMPYKWERLEVPDHLSLMETPGIILRAPASQGL